MPNIMPWDEEHLRRRAEPQAVSRMGVKNMRPIVTLEKTIGGDARYEIRGFRRKCLSRQNLMDYHLRTIRKGNSAFALTNIPPGSEMPQAFGIR